MTTFSPLNFIICSKNIPVISLSCSLLRYAAYPGTPWKYIFCSKHISVIPMSSPLKYIICSKHIPAIPNVPIHSYVISTSPVIPIPSCSCLRYVRGTSFSLNSIHRKIYTYPVLPRSRYPVEGHWAAGAMPSDRDARTGDDLAIASLASTETPF